MKKITIRIKSLQKNDLKSAKMFAGYVNALVKDKEPIVLNEKITIEQERRYLKEKLINIRNHKEIYLVAMDKGYLAGIVHITLKGKRQNHIGELGISVRKEYRGKGLGRRLMLTAISETRKLRPVPIMLRLSVMVNNKPAIKLYEKFGFKKIATVPEQIKTGKELVDEIIMLLYL